MFYNFMIKKAYKFLPFTRKYLYPCEEVIDDLFNKYNFKIDLRLGSVQRHFFLTPNTYENEVQKCFRNIIKPNMIVFDIGAHIGYFTILLSDLVGKNGKVFAFEAHPKNFELLSHNVKINILNNVSCFNNAVSEKNGFAVLSINPINDGGHSLGDLSNNPDLNGFNPNKYKIHVPTVGLDIFVKEHSIPNVDFIKLDVEGAEHLVLNGAKNILGHAKSPQIICEIGDIAQKQMNSTEKDLRDIFYKYGYRSFIIEENLHEILPREKLYGMKNILFKK